MYEGQSGSSKRKVGGCEGRKDVRKQIRETLKNRDAPKTGCDRKVIFIMDYFAIEMFGLKM